MRVYPGDGVAMAADLLGFRPGSLLPRRGVCLYWRRYSRIPSTLAFAGAGLGFQAGVFHVEAVVSFAVLRIYCEKPLVIAAVAGSR
jgi:hypothetical protein